MKHYTIFGKSLIGGVQKVGQADAVVHIIGILVYAISISHVVKHPLEDLGPLTRRNFTGDEFDIFEIMSLPRNTTCTFRGTDGSLNSQISISVAGMLVQIFELLLALILMRFGKERDLDRCALWVRLTIALSSLEALVVLGSQLIQVNESLASFIVLNVLYKSYSTSLVRAYRTTSKKLEELSTVPSTSDTPPPVTSDK